MDNPLRAALFGLTADGRRIFERDTLNRYRPVSNSFPFSLTLPPGVHANTEGDHKNQPQSSSSALGKYQDDT